MLSDIGIEMKFAVVLVVSCVLIWGDAKKVRCMRRERQALLSLKNGLIDESGILSSWKSEECCNWYGVVCSNTTGNVISLQLYSADNSDDVLGGNITSSLIDLHHLISLDLSYNDFGGLPIPEFIGSMKQLQYLYLRNSGFSGTVPTHLGNLTNLLVLDLSHNYFLSSKNFYWLSSLSLLYHLDLSSSFDLNHTNSLQQILNLRSLKDLFLKSCNISDAYLSASLFVNSSSSTSLSFLDLSGNHLTSSAFNWLSNVSSSLVKLRLEANKLRGQIPDVFERFINLEFIDVSNNMLEGEIPKSLGNLTQLKVLVFYGNGFRGEVHELVGNISASTGILRSLQILDLAHNQLTGPVPDLTQFSALTQVYLGSNKLTGTLPLCVGQLANLRILEISHNNLEGSVTESHFIKLHNLNTLYLSFTSLKFHIGPDWSPPFQLERIMLANCSVGPSFPKWIQTQTNLSVLDLSRGGIADEVPSWLWTSFPLLTKIFLSHNQISGTIPDLSSIPLKGIDVGDNKFSGLIPLFHPNTESLRLTRNMFFGSISSICEIRHNQLGFLGLSNNQLSGELPNCWEMMPHLFVLGLANNSFSNKIPHSLGSLHYLEELQLRDNNLSGELPSTLRFCQGLALIDVGGNELTGEIPSWIGEIYKLRILNLGSNRLQGTIPPSICNLTLVQVLDIRMNNLSGRIPDCFNNLTTLALIQFKAPKYGYASSFRISYNPRLPNMFSKVYDEYSLVGWKGQELEYKKNLHLLGLLDFSSNRLTGKIPESFSSLRGLRSLNLSRNSLTGNIIPDIGNMELIEVLDLSNNQLSDEIPSSLAKLHYLAFLDLSNNNLSGKIPSSTQLQSFDATSYVGNNRLCGQPLTLCPQDIPRPPLTAKVEKDDESSELSFMQEVGISMAFGFIFGFWGVVGSLILMKSWRYAFFNSWDAAGEWLCARRT